jgi:hypothetical protein
MARYVGKIMLKKRIAVNIPVVCRGHRMESDSVNSREKIHTNLY